MWLFCELPEGDTRESQRTYTFDGLHALLKAEASVKEDGEAAYIFGDSPTAEDDRAISTTP